MILSDTVKIKSKGNTRFIAHRGLSGLETENTNAAFVAAGNHSYFGIETDVHCTADGKYVIIHDDTTGRVCAKGISVEKSAFDTLRSLILKQPDGKTGRSDLRIPTPEEYIGICKKYRKTSVLELKNPMPREAIFGLCDTIGALGYLRNVIFISFCFENLSILRERYPNQPAQFLTDRVDDGMLSMLAEKRIGLDVCFSSLSREAVRRFHNAGLAVNCWTVDEPADAERLIDFGVDFITTNILE